ncbi:MAG: hypothetical protein AAF357_11405, partial [Verrucomicrobiota bacterium]
VNTNYISSPPPPTREFFVETDLVPKIFNVTIFPGFTVSQMRKVFLDSETHGIMMRTYGTGNVPGNQEFLDTIAASVNGDAIDANGKTTPRSIEDGRLIVNVSQCPEGTVEMGLYEASTGLMEQGVLSGLDMTPEATLTKLMWSLGSHMADERVTQMQIAQCGEQTENLFDLRFGIVSEPVTIFRGSVNPDGRLDHERISKAMLRLSQMKFDFGEHYEELLKEHRDSISKKQRQGTTSFPVQVDVFMNMPSADHKTSMAIANTDHQEHRLVTQIRTYVDEEGGPITKMANITYATQRVIRSGPVSLTIVVRDLGLESRKQIPEEYFEGKGRIKLEIQGGIFIALYAEA